ncbi:MAG: hypothetical protein QXT13_10200, partial [Pyrobaculum sp.]
MKPDYVLAQQDPYYYKLIEAMLKNQQYHQYPQPPSILPQWARPVEAFLTGLAEVVGKPIVSGFRYLFDPKGTKEQEQYWEWYRKQFERDPAYDVGRFVGATTYVIPVGLGIRGALAAGQTVRAVAGAGTGLAGAAYGVTHTPDDADWKDKLIAGM